MTEKTTTDRVLVLEINYVNFMKTVNDKFDAIITKLDELPKIYEKKDRVDSLCARIDKIEKIETETKTIRSKNLGMIIVGIISLIGTIVSVFGK